MGRDLDIDLGDRTLVLHNRYETLSIVNDALIAVWFIVGSILFFDENTSTAGTWLFLAGSVELLIRPVIRLSRNIHIRSVSSRSNRTNGSNDFCPRDGPGGSGLVPRRPDRFPSGVRPHPIELT